MLVKFLNLVYVVGGLYTVGLFVKLVIALIKKTPVQELYESLVSKKYALIICLIVLIDTPIIMEHSIRTRIPEKTYPITVTLNVPEKNIIATVPVNIEYSVEDDFVESGRDSDYLFGGSSGDSYVVTERFSIWEISYKGYDFSDVLSDFEYGGVESGKTYSFTIGIPIYQNSNKYRDYPATIKIPELTLSLLNITREDQKEDISLSSYIEWGAVIFASIFNIVFLIYANRRKESETEGVSRETNPSAVNVSRDIPTVKPNSEKNSVELAKESFFSSIKSTWPISKSMSDRVFDQKQIITETFKTNGKDTAVRKLNAVCNSWIPLGTDGYAGISVLITTLKGNVISPLEANRLLKKYQDECGKTLSDNQVITAQKEIRKERLQCQNCGHEVKPDDMFCSKCGTRLQVPSKAPAQQIVPKKTLTYDDKLIIQESETSLVGTLKVDAEITIVRSSGNEKREVVTIYQKSPDTYYISRSRFNSLRSSGVLCVQVYDGAKERDRNFVEDGFALLDDQSLLAICGYTTRAKDDLTDAQRQKVLLYLLKNDFWTKKRLVSHLEWCIRNHPQDMYELNRQKWEKDIRFIKQTSI